MTKDIKDYLHLYVGCDVRISRPSGLSIEKLTHARLNDLHTVLNKSWDLHKPILRPLSDMTEEEKLKLYSMGFTCNKGMQILHPDQWKSFTSEQTRYLLSLGFDLFGLIDSGLAINKTTLK